MRSSLLGLVLSLLTGWAAPGAAAQSAPDASYAETRTFIVRQGRADTFGVKGRVEVAHTFRSERSTQQDRFVVAEPFYATLSNLRGTFQGERIRQSQFGTGVPEWEDVFLSGGRVHYAVLPDAAEVGDRLEYSYDLAFLDVGYLPVVRVPAYDHVERFEVVVEHPADVAADFEVFLPRAEHPYEVDRSEPKRTVLRFAEIEADRPLPYFGFNDLHAAVLVRLTQGGAPITPSDTDAFATWYRGLVGMLETGDLASIAQDLGGETDSARVAAIHDYVRSTVRYVADERGENAIIPRAPRTVLAQGYGDCKDRAYLAQALAAEHGIDLDVVLLHTEPVPAFEGTQVGLFNHVIVRYSRPDAPPVYFDPTHRYAPFSALPDGDVEADALVLTAAGAERVVLPAPPAQPNVALVIDADASALDRATAEITLRGDYFAMAAQVRAEQGPLEVENTLRALTAPLLHKLLLHRFRLTDEGPDHLTFSADADLSDFAIASPTRLYLPKTPFRAIDPDVLERAGDAHPLHLPARYHVQLDLALRTEDRVPDADTLAMGTADGPLRFSAWIAPGEEGGARVRYTYHAAQKRLAGDRKAAFLDAAAAYLQARSAMFVLREPAPDAPPPTEGTPGSSSSDADPR
jgi:hypothetical protein